MTDDIPMPRPIPLGTGSNRAERKERKASWLSKSLCALLGIGEINHEVDSSHDSAAQFPTAYLALNTSVVLLISALAANASRQGASWAIPTFYACVAAIYLPIVIVTIRPGLTRSNRIANVILAGMGLFCLRVIREPEFFTGHDEYLHWVTALQIIEQQRLFSPNVLFPIGPFFPGLEILTSAFSELSGLSVFDAGMIIIGLTRFIFIGALFYIYENVSGSDRIASIACLIYMGSSTFAFFDTNFSYAGLAIALLAMAMMVNLESEQGYNDRRTRIAFFFIYLLIVLALSMTHHVTAYALSGLFVGIVILDLINRGHRISSFNLICMALVAVAVPVVWSKAMGNPGAGYLGPVFQNGLKEVSQLLHFTMTRKLFTGDDGIVAPFWQRYLTLGSVALICLGLSLGLFRSLSWAGISFARTPSNRLRRFFNWDNSRLVLFTLLTLGFPLSIIFRLTRSGWEIGNRIGPFAFLGVGLVLAICISTFLLGMSRSLGRASLIGICATVMTVGGIISSEGPRILVPAKFQVSADSASIEPMGIRASQWTKQWLGEGKRFAADRVNRLLLSGYGRQLVSTTLKHKFDVGVALVSSQFGKEEQQVLERIGIEYLFADLRLTTGKPVVGAYFDGAAADHMLDAPPQADSFLKFNSMPGVNRIFDNGYSLIYDVRAFNIGSSSLKQVSR